VRVLYAEYFLTVLSDVERNSILFQSNMFHSLKRVKFKRFFFLQKFMLKNSFKIMEINFR